MERMGPSPLSGRFWFRALLFNAILLVSVIAPTLIIRNMDYEELMDRISFQTSFFRDFADELRGLTAD